MFERYSESARRALFFARYEASHLSGTRLETEHILLGLIGRPTPNADQVLPRVDLPSSQPPTEITHIFARAGVDLDAVRREVESRTVRYQSLPVSMEIPFSPAVERILLNAATEADALGCRTIGPEHLLLAILSVDEGLAAATLVEQGMSIQTAREIVRAIALEPPAE